MHSMTTNKGIFKSIDWLTILLYLVLIGWGWVSVCGSSYDFNNPDIFSWETRSGKQLVWLGCSVGLAGMLMLIEKRFYTDTAYYLYIGMMFLLVATIFIAPDTKGSRSWIPIGSVMKLQPAEFAKFTVALTIGRYMDKYGFNLHDPKRFMHVAGLIFLPMVLIVAQRETGSALVYLAFFLVLYREGMTGSFLLIAFTAVIEFVIGIKFDQSYIADMPVSIGKFVVLIVIQLFTIGMALSYCKDRKAVGIISTVAVAALLLALLFSAFVIPFDVTIVQTFLILLTSAYLLWLAFHQRAMRYFYVALFALGTLLFYFAIHHIFTNILEKHQKSRIEVFLGMDEDVSGAGYNVNQAKIAIGSGGMTGKGFLKGTQTKLKYVPEQDTDFIFCTIGEEEGFVGSAGVLILYLLFIWRLLALAERQPDRIGRVYGYSVVCIFLFHLFINVGMVIGLAPVIGIPLPFFSYGGSSLWGFTILLFIFLRMDAERHLKEK